MNSKIRGRCGFSRTETVRLAPEGAPTEADSGLRKAIPQIIELIRLMI